MTTFFKADSPIGIGAQLFIRAIKLAKKYPKGTSFTFEGLTGEVSANISEACRVEGIPLHWITENSWSTAESRYVLELYESRR